MSKTPNKRPDGVPHHWAIFCSVVDNFGDIGVCMRLARTLAVHHGQRVELRVDDWKALRRLCPAAPASASPCTIDGVLLRPWHDAPEAAAAADVIIEAFACELPDALLTAMAERARPPCWINLEYLSAEDWVDGCHRLRSPHPRLPLVKHFFFPGFTAHTGGLLSEPGLIAAREAFASDRPTRIEALARRLGHAIDAHARIVSLFCYPHEGLQGLFAAWADAECPTCLLVPEGRIADELAASHGAAVARPGLQLRDGALHVEIVPFSDQDGYDRLLWCCDLNFVRGEDSFVRAQWAARPFVWHVYAQRDDAHFDKLEAFIARFTEGLEAGAADALRRFWRAWNGYGEPRACWPAFAAALPVLESHAHAWAQAQARLPDLASSLVDFVETSV